MGHRRQLAARLISLAAGFVGIAIGASYRFADPTVALGYLLVAPMLVSFFGTVLIVASLARRTGNPARAARVYRIVGVSSMSGLGLALLFGAAGILSQVPDSLAGLNGQYIPGSSAALGALVLAGIGLSAGLVIGVLAALVWWAYRGRHATSQLSDDAPLAGSR